MKLLLTIAIVAGFAVAANATTPAAKTTTTTTTTATPADCTKGTPTEQKACTDAAAHAAAPAATPAKKK